MEVAETGSVSRFHLPFETTQMPITDRHYPSSEVAEALRQFGEGHVRAKVVKTSDLLDTTI